MKELLFNLACTQPGLSGKRHGGGKYGEIVFRRILERELPVVAYHDSSRWFNPVMQQLIEENGIKLLDRVKNGTLNEALKKFGIKRVYSPIVNDEVLDIASEFDVVATIHGLRPLELSYDSMMLRYNSCSLREKLIFVLKKYCRSLGYKHACEFYQKAYAKKNLRFAMVSNHSVSTLLAYLPQFKDKGIKAFYSPSTSTNNVLLRKYTDKYYLMVSANRWEKNCLRGIMAFDRLFANGFLSDTKVRITGVTSVSAYKYSLQRSDRFEFMGYVDDDELEQLYHDAYGFVYPSLNEGFGYPPMEAMHHGVPCIVSPFTSIPEICQGAALYANPYSVEELMGRILILDQPRMHDKYSMLATKQEQQIRIKQNQDLDGFVGFIYE